MTLFLPLLILGFGTLFLMHGKRCSAAFLRGAADGLSSCASLFPTLLLFVCAASVFRASGAIDLLTAGLSDVFDKLHIASELLPLLLIRPISGSASVAVLSDLLLVSGADSPIGLTASVLCGASETVLYVLSVYAGGMPLQGTRYLAAASALTFCFVTVLSLLICRLMFGI